MTLRPFKRVRPGGQFSASEHARLQSTVEGLTGIGSAVGSAVQVNYVRGQPRLVVPPAGEFWVKVTGSPTGSAYPWAQQTDNGAGTFAAYGDGVTGTATLLPAYEVNANLAVPTGAVCRAWLSDGGESVLFAYTPNGTTNQTFTNVTHTYVNSDLTFDANSSITTSAPVTVNNTTLDINNVDIDIDANSSFLILCTPVFDLRLRLKEVAAPGAAPAGYVDVYPKANGRLYFTDDTGTELLVTSAPSGGGTTNALPKFTSGSGGQLNNSSLSDDGAAVTCEVLLQVDAALHLREPTGNAKFAVFSGTNGAATANVATTIFRADATNLGFTNLSGDASNVIFDVRGDGGRTPLYAINGTNGVTVSVGALSFTGGILTSDGSPANGALLIGNGTGYSGATLTAGAGVTITNGAGSITLAAAYVQRVYAEYTTSTALSATIPQDDTIPQNTEGTEIVTATITPTSTSNRIRVRFQCFCSGNAAISAQAALFRDTGANALRATATDVNAANVAEALVLEFEEVAPSTSAITYKIRAGPTANNMYVNGNAGGGRFYGGVAAATLIVEELKA